MDVVKELNAKWQQRYQGLARLQFSHWTPWRQRNRLSSIDKVGVYILAKYEPNDEIPAYVDPLDNHVIYFGKTNVGRTTSLRNRLNQFDGAAFGSGAPHAGGYNYKQIFGTNQDGLHVSICPVYWDYENSNPVLDEAGEFLTKKVITCLETCLRGVYVYSWGNLPKCNKE